MTPFGLLLYICGLSTNEAARIFNLPHGTVKSWASGRNAAPAQMIAELRWLYRRIVESAELQMAEIRQSLSEFSDVGRPPAVDIKMPASDKEAQAMGMPTVGEFAACALESSLRFSILMSF